MMMLLIKNRRMSEAASSVDEVTNNLCFRVSFYWKVWCLEGSSLSNTRVLRTLM